MPTAATPPAIPPPIAAPSPTPSAENVKYILYTRY